VTPAAGYRPLPFSTVGCERRNGGRSDTPRRPRERAARGKVTTAGADQADEKEVQDDHVRSDLLAAAAPRGSFTGGKSLGGQRVTSVAGSLSLGPMPGSPLAAGATLI
jgi:hypothetical protein